MLDHRPDEEFAKKLDAEDPVRGFRERFCIPAGQDGQPVVYFCGNKPKHIGVMRGMRVVSKWGKTPVYNHEILEVLPGYGDEIPYYQKPPDQLITTQFIAFVRSHERYVDCREAFEEWVKECGYGADSN